MANKNDFTFYKLLILYLLSRVDFPLTTSQISEFVLDHGYTTYFKFQEALNEMSDDSLIVVESTHNRSLHHLTTLGLETIELFEEQLSTAIKDDVKNYIREKHYDLKGESGVKSTFRKDAKGDFIVRCQIVENGVNLFDLRLRVPTEKEAESIANNWINRNEEVYTNTLHDLLS